MRVCVQEEKAGLFPDSPGNRNHHRRRRRHYRCRRRQLGSGQVVGGL